MKTKPITFDAHSIQSILNGQKTQFRRVINPSPEPVAGGIVLPIFSSHCPYGYLMDTLWVRETWLKYMGLPFYRADNDGSLPDSLKQFDFKWKSPVTMPKTASRITLEITGVRAERLQDITRTDIYAEGFTVPTDHKSNYKEYLLESFVGWWDRSQKHPWDSNPWVWVVNFKRID